MKSQRVRWMLGLATVIIGPTAVGQTRGGFAFALGVDAGLLPDGFTTRCGRSRTGMAGVSGFGAVRYQPERANTYLQLDLKVARAEAGACTADLPIVWLSPTEYETRPGVRYSSAIPRAPFGASAVRVGWERRVGAVAAGLFAGAGLAWASRPVPLAGGGLSVGIGRGSLRFTLEGERTLAWVGGEETYSRRAVGAPERELSQRVIRHRRPQPWTVARIGLLWRRA